jgi:hypothetical protein
MQVLSQKAAKSSPAASYSLTASMLRSKGGYITPASPYLRSRVVDTQASWVRRCMWRTLTGGCERGRNLRLRNRCQEAEARKEDRRAE